MRMILHQRLHMSYQPSFYLYLGHMVLLALGLMGYFKAMAQSADQPVDRIKAAYIFNFAKFVELPGADDKPIRLCVLGRDDLNGAMQGLNRRVAQGRELIVRNNVALDQAKDCAIVFVGEAEARLLPAAARQLGSASVLLVSDARHAVDQGAHLSLVFNDDRVEFEVNLQHLQKSGIKASSQMLKLARNVIR
jgi:YfiR/HmsC-like